MSKKRLELKKIYKIRTRFKGVFVRIGIKTNTYTGWQEETLLLRDIIELETGKKVTDHLWFNYTKGFKDLGELSEGDILEFDARVTPYKKGYRGYDDDKWLANPPRIDYKLSRPTKIKKVCL